MLIFRLLSCFPQFCFILFNLNCLWHVANDSFLLKLFIWCFPYFRITWWSKNATLARIVNFIEWAYWRWTVQWLWKVVCVVCALMTIILIWNEETMFTSFLKFFKGMPQLSIYYLIIWKPHNITPIAIQIFTFITLGYNTWCTYDSLMNIRLFNWYKLLPYQQTDTYSLLFSAAYLCRIGVPVALNYLYLIGFDVTNSAFVRVMGTMTVVPFFGGNFNVIFPALILLVALATLFDLWNRIFFILTCGRWKSFEYDEFSEDEYTSTGRELMLKEREAEQRGTGVDYFGERVVRHGLAGAGAGLHGGEGIINGGVDPEMNIGGTSPGNGSGSDSNMVQLEDLVGPTPSRPGDRFRSAFGAKNGGGRSPAPTASLTPSFASSSSKGLGAPSGRSTPAPSSESSLRSLWESSSTK